MLRGTVKCACAGINPVKKCTRACMAEKSESKVSETKDVEMAVEGEGTGEDKEGGGNDAKNKQQAQKDKDLLTFEGIIMQRSCDTHVTVM